MGNCVLRAAIMAKGSPGGFEKGGFWKFQNFELGIEIYVEWPKEFSGAIRLSKFLIKTKLQPFKDIFFVKISIFEAV